MCILQNRNKKHREDFHKRKNLNLLNTKNLISDEGYFFTLPTKYEGNYIDGFFSVELERND